MHALGSVDSGTVDTRRDVRKDDCKDELCTITPNSSLTSLSTLAGPSPCPSPPLTLLLSAPPRLDIDLHDVEQLDVSEADSEDDGRSYHRNPGDGGSQSTVSSSLEGPWAPPFFRRWTVQLPIMRANLKSTPSPLVRAYTM